MAGGGAGGRGGGGRGRGWGEGGGAGAGLSWSWTERLLRDRDSNPGFRIQSAASYRLDDPARTRGIVASRSGCSQSRQPAEPPAPGARKPSLEDVGSHAQEPPDSTG